MIKIKECGGDFGVPLELLDIKKDDDDDDGSSNLLTISLLLSSVIAFILWF